MTEIMNVGANNSEIMSDSILVGSISLPSRQRTLRGKRGKLAYSFQELRTLDGFQWPE